MMTNRGPVLVALTINLVLVAGLSAAGNRSLTVHDIPNLDMGPRPEKAMPVYPSFDAGLGRALLSGSPLVAAQTAGFKVRDGLIQVNIHTQEEQIGQLVTFLRAHDASNVLTAWNQVEAFVSPETLDLLASHPDVLYVRRPSYVVPREQAVPSPGFKTGTIVSEGVAAVGADRWHAAGVTGEGVRVGVIDAQFARATNLAGSELPPASQLEVRDFTGLGIPTSRYAVHGTACAEVIYDLAPGVDRMYLAQVSTPVEIANAEAWLESEGVKVISMSLGWLSWGVGDGTGDLSDTIGDFSRSGGTWVNAAGNSALAHWQGEWRDSDHDGWLNFEADREVDFITWDGEYLVEFPGLYQIGVNASLVYDQWSDTRTDLDLCLVRWDGVSDDLEVVDCADSDNLASGLPFEDLATATDGWGFYGFAVWRASGPETVGLEFFDRFDGNPLQYRSPLGSTVSPSDSRDAIAVAAVDVTTFDLESYSSWGPTNGPGGSVVGGRTKPDIAAFANVSTASYGPGAFSGTSAAAPHVAGVAALIRGAFPDWPRWQVQTYLEDHCVDSGLVGQDVQYGHGRLRLPAPPDPGPGLKQGGHTQD